MNITPFSIKIKDLVKNYKDTGDDGVFAYDNLLTVRPPYQREFVYKDKQRDAVIDTILKGFPLNTMYWVKNGDHFELLDGQQRTISICQFVNGDFSIKHEGNSKYFSTFPTEIQDKINNYELFIYVCEGNNEEKLDWFRTINIAGEKLTEQELRNINYVGEWLTDAKRYFSKSSCKAMKYKEILSGKSTRQEYLETVLTWASEDGDPSSYMAKHKADKNANELWEYFEKVMTWFTNIFPKYDVYKKELKGQDFGAFYKKYKDVKYNSTILETKVTKLMADEDVTNKKGIFEYLLSEETETKLLNLRTFNDSQKRTVYAQQKGICPICGNHFEYEEMEGDHIVAWSKGGKTEIDNLQMLCKECNKSKSNK